MQPKCDHIFLLTLTRDDGRLMYAGDVSQKALGPHIVYPFSFTLNITETP
jgi:hypothetical protein